MSVCAKTSKASRSAVGAGVLTSLWQKHKRDKSKGRHLSVTALV